MFHEKKPTKRSHRKWRNNKKSYAPIIVISCYNDPDKKIQALNLWADDYMTKPFDINELVARICAINRRDNKIIDKKTIKYKNITLDLYSKKIKLWKKIIDLTKKERSIIEYFLKNKWKLIKKDELINKIWGMNSDKEITDNTVNATLSKVRAKLWKKFTLITKINSWYILEI